MSPTYTNVADICIPLIDFSSSGRAVRPLRRPFPAALPGTPAKESADERRHERPRPLLRAAGPQGTPCEGMDAGRVRPANRLHPRGDIPNREREPPADRDVRADVRPCYL